MNLEIPREYGGAGLGSVESVIVVERWLQPVGESPLPVMKGFQNFEALFVYGLQDSNSYVDSEI